MFIDGYVQLLAPGDESDKYVFLIGHVKPRTNDKDPISKLPYYKLWIILDKNESHSRVFTAQCSCKGGNDGYCRHVVAAIFELMDFINDKSKQSITSGPCQWERRKVKTSNITPITIALTPTTSVLPR